MLSPVNGSRLRRPGAGEPGSYAPYLATPPERSALTALVEKGGTAPAKKSRRRGLGTFLRFVACGGGTGLAAGGTLSALPEAVPMPLANAVITILATLLTNELHSRITFRRGRASRRVHLQSTGTAAASYLFTTSAMLVLGAATDHPAAALEQVVYLVASSLAGIGRFALLRLFVFRTKAQDAAPA